MARQLSAQGLRVSEQNGMLSMLHNLSISVNNGQFTVTFSRTGGMISNTQISYTASSSEVPISGGGTTQVLATVTYTFCVSKSNWPSDSEFAPETVEELMTSFGQQVVAIHAGLLLAGAIMKVVLLSIAVTAAPALSEIAIAIGQIFSKSVAGGGALAGVWE